MNNSQIDPHRGRFKSLLGRAAMLVTGVSVAIFLIVVATATISYSAARR